jgi:hypothetical protein
MSFGRRTTKKSHPVFRFLDSELGAMSIVVVIVRVARILIPRAAAH